MTCKKHINHLAAVEVNEEKNIAAKTRNEQMYTNDHSRIEKSVVLEKNGTFYVDCTHSSW